MQKKQQESEETPRLLLTRAQEAGLSFRPSLSTFLAFLVVFAASMGGRQLPAPAAIGRFIVCFLVYLVFLFAYSRRVTEKPLSHGQVYMMSAITAFYLTAAAVTRSAHLAAGFLPTSVLLPTALAVMLPAVLIRARLGLVMALILPHACLLTGVFDIPSYIFALISGAAAALVIRDARERLDMVKSGFAVALINALTAAALLLIRDAPPLHFVTVCVWAAVNGAASGMLSLGVLPLLELALHQATTFRLIELSDTGAPLLRRLSESAPGTYAHSLEVADLAGSACFAIGANGLLARVGGLYHDIGKIENPDYFVENQHIYNKHTELNPRLSATVIRSHVKLGIEKARAVGLPDEIIDIISSHHGNSLIQFFYAEALKQEGEVDTEDFKYPGRPPRSKEAAVVMLADVVEAAVRTLDKPTVSRLEKFIQELLDKKVGAGQLAESDLTFRELGEIKKSFVRTLAARCHSRIDYPKLPDTK